MRLDKNYYEILDVGTTASQEDIQRAYVRAKNAYTGENLALYSLMSKNECDEILQQVEEAYHVLNSTENRKAYDQAKGINPQTSNPTQDVSDFFYQKEETRVEPAPTNNANPQEEPSFSIGQNEKASFSKISSANRFSLKYEINNSMEQEILEATVYTGNLLKKIREYKNVDVPRLANMTRLSKTYIKNIEDENLQGLPATVYVRGFVFQMAKCLKLNPELVANSYMGHIEKLKNAKG